MKRYNNIYIGSGVDVLRGWPRLIRFENFWQFFCRQHFRNFGANCGFLYWRTWKLVIRVWFSRSVSVAEQLAYRSTCSSRHDQSWWECNLWNTWPYSTWGINYPSTYIVSKSYEHLKETWAVQGGCNITIFLKTHLLFEFPDRRLWKLLLLKWSQRTSPMSWKMHCLCLKFWISANKWNSTW